MSLTDPGPPADPHRRPRFRGRSGQQLRESFDRDPLERAAIGGRNRPRHGTRVVPTKHSIGVWSASPGDEPFRFESAQSEVDALPQRAPAADGADGADGEIETYTVVYGRDSEPELGIVAILTPDGARVWGTITDTDTLTSLTVEEGCGRSCRLRADGKVDVR